MKKYFIYILILIISISAALSACKADNAADENEVETKYLKDSNAGHLINVDTDISQNLIEYINSGILIGVQDDTIYYAQLKGQKMFINTLENISSETPHQGTVCVIDCCMYEFFHEIINGKIYIGYLTTDKENNNVFKLLEIVENGSCKSIYSNEVYSSPRLSFCDNAVFIAYETDTGSRMESLSLTDYNTSVIKDSEFRRDENGRITGEWILYSGTYDNQGVYYETAQFDNEDEMGGDTKLYYHSFISGKNEFVMELEDKSRHISGDAAGNILLCNYEIADPNAVTGRILFETNNGFVETEIDEITACAKIINSSKISERYIAGYNFERIFIFDTDYRVYKTIRISDYDKEIRTSDVKFGENVICYLKFSPDSVNLVTHTIN